MRIQIRPFSPKGVERTERVLAKQKLNTKVIAENFIFKTEDNGLRGKLQDKYMNKKNFFCILKVAKERSWILSCILWILIQHFRSIRMRIWFRIQAFDDQKIV
jgi:hypothetical protein